MGRHRRRRRASTESADKQVARDIEARERARVLDARHGIKRLPDVTFRAFAVTYLRDHADLNKKSAGRDHEIVRRLLPVFGRAFLHEITPHRIEQWKRERLAGRWRAHGQTGPTKAVKPATVNRELDTLKSILAKAVEWGLLQESPARPVRRLKVENRRTRILSAEEAAALLAAAAGKVRAFIGLALITGARAGELLGLTWANVRDGEIVFLETNNGRMRRLPRTPQIDAILDSLPRQHTHVFTNPKTRKPHTVNGVAHVVRRAYQRAGIRLGDVTIHTLRHTALSRMVADGADVFTVMAISGHSSVRMLERYTHPATPAKIKALESARVVTNWSQWPKARGVRTKGPAVTGPSRATYGGGWQEARTPDLRVANDSETGEQVSCGELVRRAGLRMFQGLRRP